VLLRNKVAVIAGIGPGKLENWGGMSTLEHLRLALLSGSVLSLLPVTASFAAETEADDKLQTVVVTAQKRQENLQSVPIAVTAISSETLQDTRFENLGDLSAAAPGMTVRTGAGGTEAPNVTMRGIYGSGTFASDPGVALYVDGVYLSSVNGAEFDLAGVERIEVLRGPQGTLFGRNTLAGAVNVITREPTGTFDAYQQLSYGNFDQFRSKTSVDLPAWGPLSASLTYLHDQRNGDVRNLGAGTVWNYGPATDGEHGNLVSPSTLGGHDTDAVSASLKLEPGSDIKAVYRFNYSHKSYSPDAVGILSFDTGPGTNAYLSGLFQSFWEAQNPAIRTPISSTRPDALNNWYSTTTAMSDQSHNLTLTIPVGNGVTIKNLTAYRTVNVFATNQLDGFGGMFIAPHVPLLTIQNDTQSNQKSWQEELQADIDTRFVKSTFGYIHYYSKTIEGGFDNVANAPFGSGLFPGAPAYVNFVAPALPGVLDDGVSLTSDAGYTQNEIPILPKLDLVLGGRYTWDRRGGLDNSPTPSAPGVPATYSKGTPTYLAGLNYQLNDAIFTYAKFSTGYISGGRLANVPFNPSFAKSYELGVKSDLLDHELRVNLAAYTVKYTDLQVLTNPTVGCGNIPGVSVFASQCIVNGGDERTNGVEAEVTLVPVTGLTLASSLGYTNVTLSDTPLSLRGPDGTFVPTLLPEWTATASGQYTSHGIAGIRGAHIIGHVGANYTSSSFGSTPNSGLAVADAARIPSRVLVDARLGIGGYQVGSAELEVAGFVKNLTNNRSITYDFNAGALIPAQYQTARMLGIDLIATF
jgi:iron complex outermembrane receptor protein